MNLLTDLFLTFGKIGAFTFGGGYAMIALIDHECVEKKHWLTSDELADITVIAESTPGPIAINCATYTGYQQKGILGAIFATLGMVLPSFLIILLISFFFERALSHALVVKAFSGIRIAVAFLIIQAAINMIRKMRKKTPNKISSTVFVAASFSVVLLLNLFGVGFSTIYLMGIAGCAGYFLYGLPKKGGKA